VQYFQPRFGVRLPLVRAARKALCANLSIGDYTLMWIVNPGLHCHIPETGHFTGAPAICRPSGTSEWPFSH